VWWTSKEKQVLAVVAVSAKQCIHVSGDWCACALGLHTNWRRLSPDRNLKVSKRKNEEGSNFLFCHATWCVHSPVFCVYKELPWMVRRVRLCTGKLADRNVLTFSPSARAAHHRNPGTCVHVESRKNATICVRLSKQLERECRLDRPHFSELSASWNRLSPHFFLFGSRWCMEQKVTQTTKGQWHYAPPQISSLVHQHPLPLMLVYKRCQRA
jgi:hypothetical protein